MKLGKMIFIKRFFILPLVVGVMAFPAMAADNGCEDEGNDYVTAELALCSTHAYNINLTENPKDASGKQLMNDVIAMKTTVITQQLYKQYEQMESMLTRFKTQLEKAVLTSSMGAAGAKTDDGDDGGSYRSSDKSIILSGATNCLQVWSNGTDAALDCLGRNVQLIITAINAGNATDARKQLKKEIDALKTISAGMGDNKYATDAESDCGKVENDIKDKTTVMNCAYELNGKVISLKEQRKREEAELQRPRWGN